MTQRRPGTTRLLTSVLFLLLLAGLADWMARLEMATSPAPTLALFTALALVLGAFVALTDSAVIELLRQRAANSAMVAAGIPAVLVVPYVLYGLGTGTFALPSFFKLLVYIEAPNLLLLPDRLRPAERMSWRDAAAMLALAVPVSAGWLGGLWTYPAGVDFFRPLYSVLAGVYAFVVIRKFDGVGYSLIWRKRDLIDGAAHFAGFAALGIPLGYALDFIRFRPAPVRPELFAVKFVGIYLLIAIPEEVLFRGILQNLIEQSLSSKHRSLYALLLASPIFGAAHLYHRPAPNWRYAVMATLAGLFYGNAFLRLRRTSCSALTHALVDAVWTSWF